MSRPIKLVIGQIYYLVQYQDSKRSPPIINSYTYKGTVDGKRGTHFFESTGLSDANVFLDEAQLKDVLDIAALKDALRSNDHAS